MPYSLFTSYQEKFGISIVSVRDELRAMQVPDENAGDLKLEIDLPVLLVERESTNIDGRCGM